MEGTCAMGVQKGREAIENADEGLLGTFFELLSYRTDVETKKRRPHLTSYSTNVIPLSIQHDSYVTGESDYAFPAGTLSSEGGQFLPDDKVRAFCQRLFSLYQESKNLPQPQPQNNSG